MKTRRLLIAFCLCLLYPCLSNRSRALDLDTPVIDTPVLDKPAQAAYYHVRDAPFFALGGVGIAGTISQEEKDLGLLLQHKGAGAAFEALLNDPGTTAEGKLYALPGLKLLEARSLRAAPRPGPDQAGERPVEATAFVRKVRGYFSAYQAITAEVAVLRGCLASSRPFRAVAQDIDRGIIGLSAPLSEPNHEPAEGRASKAH
jgi:hypothetical protein